MSGCLPCGSDSRAMAAAAAVCLHPSPWRLQDLPFGLTSESAVCGSADPPLPGLLRIDRRDGLSAPVLAELAASLSAPERRHHDALRRPDDRERFLLGRGGLRRLLAAWLAIDPAAVALETGPYGKPHCPGGPQFNLSHAGDLILLAVHPSRPVGVDVERLRPDLHWRPLARRVLPAAECAALEAGEADAAAAFLAAWCRLEARLKARGEGLAGLARLRTEAEAEAGAGAGAEEVEQVWDVAVPDGYRAAVALRARPADAGVPRSENPPA